MANITNMKNIHWNWEDLCGRDGFHIWSPKTHDLGICFQELILQIPILSLLAIVSAYHLGRQDTYILRTNPQLMAINIRCFVVTLLALLPVVHAYALLEDDNVDIKAIFYILSAVQCLAWFCHLAYNLALRKRLCLSSRGPVLLVVLWSILAVASVITLRSQVIMHKLSIKQSYEANLDFAFSIITLCLHAVYVFTLITGNGEYITPEYERSEVQPLLSQSIFNRFREERDPDDLGIAMEDVSWLSKLLFYWVNPLMEKGYMGKINHADDVFELPVQLNTSSVSLKFEKIMRKQTAIQASNELTPSMGDVAFAQAPSKVSLFRALHKSFWVQFYGVGILKLIADCSGFAGPMLLNRLVIFIENQNQNIGLGYAYAFGLFLSAMISAFCIAHYNFSVQFVVIKIRAATVTTIYKKMLTVSGTVLNTAFSSGEIVNFMSTDTDRIVNACPSFHSLWSIPFQIAVSLFLLYQQVGLSFLPGVAFCILLIPINKVIANKIGDFSRKMMEGKDNRVKVMTEVLRGIQSIKLHVWEAYFVKIITKIRDIEMKHLKGNKYLDALCVYFWATTPVLIAILTFTTYVLLGNELTASVVFTTIALLNMLVGPLNAFPWVMNGLTEAWVSVNRIQKLLDLPDLNWDVYYNKNVGNDNKCIVFENTTFNWGKLLSEEQRQQLHARTNRKNKGKGKKSERTEQREPLLKDFYLENLNFYIENGEFVGVMGVVGSGKSSILQAILAELTKQCGDIAIADLEKGFGYVAQQPWLQWGTIRSNIIFDKSYDEDKYLSIVYACGLSEDFATFPQGDFTPVGESGTTLSGGQKARIALARAVYQDKSVYLLDDIISAVDSNVAKHIFQHCIMGLLKNKTVILCTHNLYYLSRANRIIVMENGIITKQGKPTDVLADIDDLLPIDIELGDNPQSITNNLSLTLDTENQDTDSMFKEEARETGTVRAGVYGSYWKAIGHLLSISILLSMFLMQSSRNLTDWWLSFWVTNASNNTTTIHLLQATAFPFQNTTQYYLIIYCLFALMNSIFTLLRAFLFAYGGIVAASKIHKLLLKTILKAKIIFFNISPMGRILNRFSSDTYTIDDSLPFILNILLAQFFGLLGAISITIYGLPWLSLILVPLIPVYGWLQNHYRLTSRELKRLSSVTLSPLYNHFNESLQGLPTIRAFRTMKRFKRINEDILESNQKIVLAAEAASRWLGLRLQFIGVAMIGGVGVLAVIQHQFDIADPGLVGLAISYALSLTGLLNGVVTSFTETEREMIAVERVNEYIDNVPGEKTYFSEDPPYAWPTQGVISFNNVIMKYREHLIPALRNVTFETRPAEKIGVVGRTGAGKSSILVSLFRLVELSEGSIVIDSVDISHLSITALRSRMFSIPQEPFLFSGTVRENLDPLKEFRDSEIWSAITRVDLAPAIRRMGGLESIITSGGANLSVGQRQLFCLARALLHNAKILCIDEATANVDQETDRQIQQTLRSAFRSSTVITIAHRTQTILDCDRVIVMSNGNIVEFDTPDNLLSDQHSHFYNLVNADV